MAPGGTMMRRGRWVSVLVVLTALCLPAWAALPASQVAAASYPCTESGMDAALVGTAGAPLTPLLGALANNGGPTLTRLPHPNGLINPTPPA